MAITKTRFRSISLPSRLHPINPTNFETELQKLKSLQNISEANSEVIQSGLVRLAELLISVEEITQSQQKSAAFEHHQSEEMLSCSVELLDSCNTIKELGQMMKESVQALQSALRRKGLDSSIQNDIASYFSFRKKMNKCVAKSLKTLKNLETKNGSSVSGDHESFIRVLREAYALTIAIFKSTLVFFSSSNIKSGSWNMVSRLMMNKSVASSKDQDRVVTEIGCVDLALSDVQKSFRNGDSKGINKQMVQTSLQDLEYCIEGIEEGFERLFRQLLQSRVTLLNILTDH